METEYIGKIARLLMTNHQKNRATTRSEIKELTLIKSGEITGIIEKTADFVERFGLEIVGVANEKIDSKSSKRTYNLAEYDRFFLRKLFDESEIKRQKIACTIEDERLYLLFLSISVENNELELGKIEDLKACSIYEHLPLEDYIKDLKMKGYIAIKEREGDKVISYGWRYYAEYSEMIDMDGLLEKLVLSMADSS